MQEWQFPTGYDETAEQHFAGFVYLITNEMTGKAYIGKKQFLYKNKNKARNSYWREYHGSCKPLSRDIAVIGFENFRREILSLHVTPEELNEAEIQEQIQRNVLHAQNPDGSKAYYNGSIANRQFCTPKKLTEEWRANIGAANKLKPHDIPSYEVRKKISKALCGQITPTSYKREGAMQRAQSRNRFSDDVVRAIRRSTETLPEICAKYGISPAHASRMRNGYTHPWVID